MAQLFLEFWKLESGKRYKNVRKVEILLYWTSPSFNVSSWETAIKWPMTRDANSMQKVYQHLNNTYIKMITLGNNNKLSMFLTYHLYEPLLITVWKVKYNYSKCMMVSAFFTEHTLSHGLFSTEFFLWWDLSHLIAVFWNWAANFSQLKRRGGTFSKQFFPPICVVMNWHSSITLITYLQICWMEGK